MPERRQSRCCSSDRGQNTQEQPPEDGNFICEHRERDRRDQQLSLSSPESDGAAGAAVNPSPTAKTSAPSSRPCALAGLHVPSPARGLIPALTSLPTPLQSQKNLISCSPLGFGNYPFGREVLATDGEVLLGQTAA